MHQVLIELPNEVWDQVQLAAARAHRPVEKYLADQLTGQLTRASVPGEGSGLFDDLGLSALSDEQLQEHIAAGLPVEIQERLTELQERNGEGELPPGETQEFDRLLRASHAFTLLKAQALRVWKERHGALPPGFPPSW